MVRKRKRKFVSLIAGASIIATMASYCSCKIAKNGYISTTYKIGKETIVDDFDMDAFENGIISGESFLYTKYAPFSSRINDLSAKTIIQDDMVPQGLTIMGDYILTTSYDHSGLNNSMVYVMNKKGEYINSYILDMDSHVGGIAYDKKNELVWIPSHSGKLNAYMASDFLDFSKKEIKAIYSNIDIGNGLLNYKNPLKNSIAFLSIYNDELFVGSFSVVSTGLVKKYDISIDDEKKLKLTYKGMFNIPNKVQGMTFYKKNDNEYIVFSRSFGRNTSSILQIFSYNENIDNYDSSIQSVTYTVPAMMEQVSLDSNCLYVIFESAAKIYRGCEDEFDSICVLDMDDVIEPLLKKRY